ncbi:hypothetical protein CE143_15770 [Photorhabdus luminescens]|uniref:Uncharacterized protein n=2 Tax=Photorhabdus akhurstii TaxID=171438 RepID=A0ABX8LYP2_9GAMM|nr:hypothetical protein B0X70_15775 [Photorhabdus akhurstii]UJD76270.1 hypothetical protein CE143_15770 [Photorhabdus luminescens]
MCQRCIAKYVVYCERCYPEYILEEVRLDAIIKEMDFNFNAINIFLTLFGFKPKNKIQEKGKTRKSEYRFNENG